MKEFSNIRAIIIVVISLGLFFYAIYVSNVFAGLIWFITLGWLSWLWWELKKEEEKEIWFDVSLGLQIYFLLFGILFCSFSQLMLAYFSLLAIACVVLFLEEPLEALCKNS